MNILDTDNLMTGGIACQCDVKIEFPKSRCCNSEKLIILFVKEGVAHVEVNFTEYELKEDRAITIVPESSVKCIDVSDNFRGSFIAYKRDFGVDVMPRPEPSYIDFIRNYPLGVIPRHRAETTHTTIGNIVYFLYQNTGAHRMQIVKNLIQCILLEHYDVVNSKFLGNKPKEINRQNEIFMEFIHLVHDYGAKHREVVFYADKLCITPRYLASIVHNVSHETAKSIIDRQCVQEIKAMLITTNRSIQSIAIELEFPDQSFFSRYFRKFTGMTPKAFRAKEG